MNYINLHKNGIIYPNIAFYSNKPQMGKTTACDYLVDIYGYQKLTFATTLKNMIRVFLSEYLCINIKDPILDVYINGSNKEVEIPGLNISPRRLMQTIGTEWGRNYVSDTVWLDIIKNKIESFDGIPICIDDMRFPNEYQMLEDMDFKLVKIVMDDDNLKSSNHISCGALKDYRFDHYIHNNMDKSYFEYIDSML